MTIPRNRWPLIAIGAVVILAISAWFLNGDVEGAEAEMIGTVQRGEFRVTVTTSGNTATAVVSLPGLASTELNLSFENPQNLSAANLGISARVVSAAELSTRLTSTELLPLPFAFPVMISVAPPALGGFRFTGAAEVEIHTHALTFSVDNLFRIYKASAGGTFHDITQSVTEGSVRTAGRTGGFSDFLILIDLGAEESKAEDQYDYIAARLTHTAISTAARSALQADLAASREEFEQGDSEAAAALLDAFDASIEDYAGNGVPNVWRSARDLDNIAGDLLSETAALRYSLSRVD